MTKLAASSGTVIYEDKNKLYITKKPAQWTSTFLFVTGLLAFILLANGVSQLFVFEMKIPDAPNLRLILFGLGVLFSLIFWRVLVYRKKVNAKPVNELKCICIIDLNNKTLLDDQQNIMAPLNQVILIRKMQLTSSSKQLALQWNKNTLTLVEGNPFAGGIEAVEQALISKGIKRK
ncbi:MAG: hypothetical protein WAT20_15210 [Ferruginibacter sp.]|nr:hypothetical protein [Chitinophagaceae bacterium]